MKYIKLYSTKLNSFVENKIFENINEDPNNSFWYFNNDDFPENSNRNLILMKKFLTGKYTHNMTDNDIKSPAINIINIILKTIKNAYSKRNITGIFLCYNNGNYSFWISTDESDNNKDYILGELEKEYEYRGDIKLDENDNIYVDKLNVEVRKYNL
jgi:hypothetical protein